MIGKPLAKDPGASLILVAISLLLLVGIAAVAVDLGAVRNDLRTSQLVSDAAVTAGAVQINPITASDAEDACEAAWAYALQNLEDEEIPTATPDCSNLSGVCDPIIARNEIGVASPYNITITHPVPDGDPLMAGQVINSGVDGAPCQRLGMTIERTRNFHFAPLVGVDSASPQVSSVARIAVRPGEGELVPLVLLEPIGCNALVAKGQAAITVEFFDDVPGIIAVDSDGSKTSNPNRCGNNQYTIHVNDNNLNWIRALPVPAPDAVDSVILAHAVPSSSDFEDADTSAVSAGCTDPPQTCFRLFPTPSATTRPITRAPIDWRYNCKGSYPVYPYEISDPSVGITILPCPDASGTPSYVELLEGQYSGSDAVAPMGLFSRWQDFYPCTINKDTWPDETLSVSGNWWVNCDNFVVNGGPTTPLDPLNPPREVIFSGGDVVFNGDVNLQQWGQLRFNPSGSADRIVYLRGGDLNKGAQTTLEILRSFVLLESPGVIDLGGGGGEPLKWTAPISGDFEDLALWAESSDAFQIGGQAGNELVGTFFTPMASPFTITGQGGQIQTQAQFLTRELVVTGQGVVRMTPDPDRSTRIPLRGVRLIR